MKLDEVVILVEPAPALIVKMMAGTIVNNQEDLSTSVA